jgi:hypothetical protein
MYVGDGMLCIWLSCEPLPVVLNPTHCGTVVPGMVVHMLFGAASQEKYS